MILFLKTRSKDRSLRQLLQGLRCFQNGSVSAFVIAWFAADMHATIVAGFARCMQAAIVTDFAGAMDAVVITDFAGTVYTVIVAWLRVGAAASRGGCGTA